MALAALYVQTTHALALLPTTQFIEEIWNEDWRCKQRGKNARKSARFSTCRGLLNMDEVLGSAATGQPFTGA